MSRGCEFYADALVERTAGRLDTDRAAHVDAHLADCADCQVTLRTVRVLRSDPLPVPTGLERRVQAAVREAGATTAGRQTATRAIRWRPWALPLAAAAAAAGIWIGVGAPGLETRDTSESTLAAVDDFDPYGAWPADDVIVAGDPLLSDLTVEELETLLRELES